MNTHDTQPSWDRLMTAAALVRFGGNPGAPPINR